MGLQVSKVIKPVGYWRYQDDYYNLMFHVVENGPDLNPHRVPSEILKAAIATWEFDARGCKNKYCASDKTINHRYLEQISGMPFRLYSDEPNATLPASVYKHLAVAAEVGLLDYGGLPQHIAAILKNIDPVVCKPTEVLTDIIGIYRSGLTNHKTIKAYDEACEKLEEMKAIAISANKSLYHYMVRELKTYDHLGNLSRIVKRNPLTLDIDNSKRAKLMSPLLEGKWYTNVNGGALSVITNTCGLAMFDMTKNTANYVSRNPGLYTKITDRLRALVHVDIPPNSTIIAHIPYDAGEGDVLVYVVDNDELYTFERIRVGNMILLKGAGYRDLYRTAILDPIYISNSPNKMYYLASPGKDVVMQVRALSPFREFVDGDIIFPTSMRDQRVSHAVTGKAGYDDFIVTSDYVKAKKLSYSDHVKQGAFWRYCEFVKHEKSKFASLL